MMSEQRRDRSLLEILDFAAGAKADRGFARLDDRGRIQSDQIEAIVNARMAYAFSVGYLELRDTKYQRLAAHAIDAIHDVLRDPDHPGFVSNLAEPDGRKSGYDLCFIAMAAATAVSAGVPGANSVLDETLGLIDTVFWNDELGLFEQSFDRSLSVPEDYIGGNVNMHALEAFLAVADATSDTTWNLRGLQIAERFVNDVARRNQWMMPEHFQRDGTVDRDYNIERIADEFRPYGVTVGHLFEWSRLILELESVLDNPPGWMRGAAKSLYETARDLGWNVDGAEGFVYTLNWDGSPLVTERMHWVCCEAIAAAGVMSMLDRAPGSATEDLVRWRAYADRYLVDHESGSWHHELDACNKPTSAVFRGKPDAYHIVQATVIPGRRPAPSAATRSAQRATVSAEVIARVFEAARGARGRPALIGVVGAPGSGKSTFAAELAAALDVSSVVIPMDGFHLANRQLREQGKTGRKGAIDTFDAEGYLSLISAVSRGEPRYAPDFSRDLDEAVAASIFIPNDVSVVITEGNYLLTDVEPWNSLPALLDEIWFIDVDDTVRQLRLRERHQKFGRDEESAVAWVRDVDEPNARQIQQQRSRATGAVTFANGRWVLAKQ